jgi:methionyl-tRNA synthetase
VWTDALSNYISAIGYESGKKFKKYWPADVHCIGKDILKFHALIWPAMLLSLGLELPRTIFAHGFISVAGQKMSKSLGNVIDPFELVKKYGTDAVRHFLLKEISPTEDGDFTYQRFEERYNSDLAKGLGNLVSRVLTMIEKYCDGKIPKIDKDPQKHPLRADENIYNWKKAWQDLDNCLVNYQFNDALTAIWKFISEADKYIDQQKPWQLFKQEKTEELNWALYGLADGLCQITWQIYAFLPETALKIAKALNIKKLSAKNPNYKDSCVNIKQGLKIEKIEPLFPRLIIQ